jgi:hypothetical protein
MSACINKQLLLDSQTPRPFEVGRSMRTLANLMERACALAACCTVLQLCAELPGSTGADAVCRNHACHEDLP